MRLRCCTRQSQPGEPLSHRAAQCAGAQSSRRPAPARDSDAPRAAVQSLHGAVQQQQVQQQGAAAAAAGAAAILFERQAKRAQQQRLVLGPANSSSSSGMRCRSILERMPTPTYANPHLHRRPHAVGCARLCQLQLAAGARGLAQQLAGARLAPLHLLHLCVAGFKRRGHEREAAWAGTVREGSSNTCLLAFAPVTAVGMQQCDNASHAPRKCIARTTNACAQRADPWHHTASQTHTPAARGSGSGVTAPCAAASPAACAA